MCVSMDTELRGLTLTLTVSPFPSPVLVASADKSEIELLLRFNDIRLINPDNDETSEIELLQRYSHVRLVNPDNDDMSEIELFQRDSHVRLIACSNPVKSLILELLASRLVNRTISDVVMGSPDALSNFARNRSAEAGVGEVYYHPRHNIIKVNRNSLTFESRNVRVDGYRTQRIDLHINRVSTPQSCIGYKC